MQKWRNIKTDRHRVLIRTTNGKKFNVLKYLCKFALPMGRLFASFLPCNRMHKIIEEQGNVSNKVVKQKSSALSEKWSNVKNDLSDCDLHAHCRPQIFNTASMWVPVWLIKAISQNLNHNFNWINLNWLSKIIPKSKMHCDFADFISP